jgi:tyrosine-specific transport protein
MDTRTYDSIATMLGAIIGAGVLGIPFVIAKAGIVPGVCILLVLGVALLILNLMLGEVVLRTKGDHQLSGYAEIYCGSWGRWVMTASMVVGVYGALTAYTVAMGDILAWLFGGRPIVWMVLAFVVMALVLAQRLRAIEGYERFVSTGKVLLLIVVAIVAFASQKFSYANLAIPTMSWTSSFGVILFALLGTAAIPSVREGLAGQYAKLHKVLVWSGVIPIVLYLVFAVAVLGVTGSATTEISTTGLGIALGPWAVVLMSVFALLAMASAYVALGEALKKTYEEDFGWLSITAWAATVTLPILLVLLGARSFITVLGITGAVAAGFDGIVICWMYVTAKKKGTRKPEYVIRVPKPVILLLALIFILALVWALTQFWH